MPCIKIAQSSSKKITISFFKVTAGVILMMTMMSHAISADWQSSNVQLLHGADYEDLGGAIDFESKTIFTFEHANGWAYGDNFFFMDVSNPDKKGTGYYAEFSPRISIGKVVKRDLATGIIKDVLIAFSQEMGSGLHARLYGAGLALNVPGFAFSDINFYARESTHDVFGDSKSGYQVTYDWLYPFSIGSSKWAFEGFIDYTFGEDGGDNPKEDNLITGPRLLVNIVDGLQFGVEYQIWRNKFGIKDVDEDVAQVMIKWTM